MKALDAYLEQADKAFNFRYACRFLEDKIIQNLKPDFDYWAHTIYGCSVGIYPDVPEGYFTTRLTSWGMDIAVLLALKDIGFDTPCHIVKDVGEGKLWSIPHAAVLKFVDDRRWEFQEWLKAKERHNFLSNDYCPMPSYRRGKEAV